MDDLMTFMATIFLGVAIGLIAGAGLSAASMKLEQIGNRQMIQIDDKWYEVTPAQ